MRYIGSKINLVENIAELLERHLDGDERSFFDIFAGTNSVGAHFKPSYKIISNDMLNFSHLNAIARLGLNSPPLFPGLATRGIHDPIDFLEQEAESYLGKGLVGYYERNYSPTGGAMYLSIDNAKRIDSIRMTIAVWEANNWISHEENAYLVDALVSAVPSVSNITGTYGAYLKHWDKRALNPLRLVPATVYDNKRDNLCFWRDANELVEEVEADIAYIDPPYNSRQYAPNYHLLENISRNQKPKLRGITRLYDWSNQRSRYCAKNKVKSTMEDLVNSVNAKHVIISYSSEGILSERELLEIARNVAVDGDIELIRIPYRKYKSKVPSVTDSVYEILLYVRKKKASMKLTTGQRLTIKGSGFIKGPLNYIGGKYRLLPQIMPLFPQHSATFVDLFSGGANVGINASADKYHFYDMNSRVNEFFRFLQVNPIEDVVSLILETIEQWGLSKTNEEAFIEFRRQYNLNPDPLSLYVLSAYSYNYQIRFNSDLKFNNPFGRNRSHFSQKMKENLINFSKQLKKINATFNDEYFDNVNLDSFTNDDFVYMDPPYLITTGSYNDGNRGFKNWNDDAERVLLDRLTILTEKGVPVALSNVLEHKGRSNQILATYVADMNMHVHNLRFNYDNASHNSKNKGSREVLITNYRLDEDGRARVNI